MEKDSKGLPLRQDVGMGEVSRVPSEFSAKEKPVLSPHDSDLTVLVASSQSDFSE